MADKCYIDYRNRSTTKSWKQEDLEREVLKIREELALEGKTFDSTIDQDLAVNKKFEERVNNTQKNSTQKMMKKLSTFDAISRITNTIDDLKGKVPHKTLMNRIVGMVFNTNDTKGLLPFEQMMKSNEKLFLGDFFRKVRDVLDGRDPVDYLKDKKNLGQVMTEYNEFFKNPNNTQSVTKNVEAFAVARELFDSQFKIAEMKKSNGFNSLISDLRLKPKWSIAEFKKIKAKGQKQQFVDEIANALDDKVHGDLARRQQLADDLFEGMLKDNADWRTIGDTSPRNIEVDNHIPVEDRKPTFAFKDGDAMVELMQKYSDNDLNIDIMRQFREMSRETALVQFFGADYKAGFEQFRRIIEDLTPTKNAKAAIGYMANKVSPVHLEHNTASSILAGIRGFQASTKLGSATVTALMDINNFNHAGKSLFGLPMHKTLGSFFQYTFKGAPEDFRKYAEYMLEGVDTYLGNIGDRFGHIGSSGAGKFEEAGSMTANALYKVSLLNWWTEGRKAMATGIYGKELGNLIKGNKAWDKMNPKFKQQLEKFGISKKDWNGLLKNQPLDQNGRLDIFKVQELDFEFSYGKSSLRQKLSAAFNDVVDTMVMTPSDFDIAITSFFNEPGTWGSEIAKTMLQFKSHPISYTRKVVWRMKKSQSKLEFAQNLTLMATHMTLMGTAVVMLKDYLKGRAPRNPFKDANIWIRGAEMSGAIGLFTDIPMQFIGAPLLSKLTDEPTPGFISESEKASQVLGPFLGDILNIMALPEDVMTKLVKGDGKELVSQTTAQLMNYVPFQNLWWAQMFVRQVKHEYLNQWFNPRKYRRQEKKLKKVSRDNTISGKPYNFFYESMKGLN